MELKSFHLSLAVSRQVAPIEIEVLNESSTIPLIAEILEVFGRPMATEVVLTRMNNETDEINLSEIERIDNRFDGKFIVTFCPIDFDFEAFYKTNFCIECARCNQATEIAFKKVFMHHVDQMNHYTAYVFRHQMLFMAVRDVVAGTPSPFSLCLPAYLKSLSKLSLFDAEVFEVILSQVFMRISFKKFDLLARTDKQHEFRFLTEQKNKKLGRLCHFLIRLLEGDLGMAAIIRKVVGLYRPALHALLFVYKFAMCVKQIYDDGTAFRILSDVFRDTWLYHCIPDTVTGIDFMNISNFLDLFPYLGARLGMEEATQKTEKCANLLEYYIGQKATLKSLRFTKAIAKPFFTHLYHLVQKEEIVPVLNLSQADITALTDAYNKHKDALKIAFSFSEAAQMKALNILLRMWNDHGFEPKGFMYANVAMMANNGLYEEALLSKWLTDSKLAVACTEALMIELNCLAMSTIPAQTPDVTDEPVSTEKVYDP